MKYLPLVFIAVLLAGVVDSCKHPTESHQTDTTAHVDTTHHAMDTTSHNFHWTEYSIPAENNLTGVAVFGPNSIYAVNNILYHFTGGNWNPVALNDTKGHAIDGLSGFSLFGFSESDCWLVLADEAIHVTSATATTAIAEDYRLADIGVTHYPTDGILHSAWGTSSHDMFFVGDNGTILHFDGTNWMKFPKVTGKNLYSVWGTRNNDVWASGYNTGTAESELLHYDGSHWNIDRLSDDGTAYQWGIGSVYVCDSAGHSVVACSGSTVIRRTDNGTWRNDSTERWNPTHIGMNITGESSNDLLSYGSWGLVCHWNGQSWYPYNQFLSLSNPAYFPRQASLVGNTACIVGIKNGTSWILVGQR